ncbi:B3 domain-containing transcription factor VRN1-like isoform X1 [Cucurbita maxima]|uniref:B3 domain-containing transcription factor VRN1-like isoform X1 n=1 Tax=Cucurbita maxima TaxID=3661 RepID=A0A6J1IQE2_CUCMA|nr:B3 domain-containing transcription factor VRN1-like isoform X1 [Cucurbita maxima]
MASSPQFFKILLHRNLEDQKLMIPKKFVKKYGKLLSSAVILKLPDGMKWKVGLAMAANGSVWLQKGWHKFANHYCLEFGSLLVFRLEGRSSSFEVTIFDPSGLESEYSSFHVCDSTTESEEDDDSVSDSDDEDYEIIGVARRRRKSATEKPGFQVVLNQSNVCGRYNMVFPARFARSYLCEKSGNFNVQTANGRKWPLLYKWSGNGDKFAYVSSGWKRFVQENLLKEGDVVFFEMIKKGRFLFTKLQDKSTASNPFFKVDIHYKSYKNRILNIPMAFGKEHFSPEMKYVKLQTGNKEWMVTLKQYEGCMRFSGGWRKFYGENGLKDGDTCLFEMHGSTSAASSLEFFKGFIPDSGSLHMNIPPAFVKHLNGSFPEKAIMKDPMGKSWRITLEKLDDLVYFKNGWPAFVDYYFLKYGDFLIFQYDGHCTFDVKIFGTNGCKKAVAAKAASCVPILEAVAADAANAVPILKVKEEPVVDKEDAKHSISSKRTRLQVGSKIVCKPRNIAASNRGRRLPNASNSVEQVGPSGPFFVRTMSRIRQFIFLDV